MSFLRRLTNFLLLAAIFFFLEVSVIFAQQGCCSWHGGISYCASNGRYVCRDGTYSPTCRCGAPVPVYKPPVPTIPESTKGHWELREDKDGNVNLYFDWDRPDNRGYSITLNKTAGVNPGPLADTQKSEIIFEDVSPGKWYINVKERMNGQWSRVTYWIVEIPTNFKKIARPYRTPTPIAGNNKKPTTEKNKEDDDMSPLTAIALVAGVPSAIIYLGKKE